MASEKQDQDGNLVIPVEGGLTAYEVAHLKDQMLMGFTNHPGVVLDLHTVDACDTLGVQLLCAANKTAQKLNKIFRVIGRPEAFLNAAMGIGLEPEDHLNFLEE